MKPLKLEPYHRSRHRAALHAWVVAATTVASIGMPSLALALDNEASKAGHYQSSLSPSQSAQYVAADWLQALRTGDRDAAMSAMRLPRSDGHRLALQTEIDALAALVAMDGLTAQPIAHRHAGHWAMSVWRFDPVGQGPGAAGMIEPITLYHPAGDDLSDASADWQVVLPGFEDDPALAPLYNADHASLTDWVQTLV